MKWSIIRAFGRVKYFNISYLILIIIPILTELYQKASLSSNWFRATIAFPVTLLWLYCASLCYALAVALYQYFCPHMVKRYASAEDLVNHSLKIFIRAHPKHRLNIVLTHLDPITDGATLNEIQQLVLRINKLEGEARKAAQMELKSLINSVHPDAVQKYLVNEYDRSNVQFRPALWIAFLLYVFGTIILISLLVLRSIHVFQWN